MHKKTPVAKKSSARKPRQSRGIETREKIIQAGEQLFAQHGFHGVLADDIAKAAGVAVGSFYAYFKDKRELFLLILDRAMAKSTTAVSTWSSSDLSSKHFDAEAFIRNTIELLVAAHTTSSVIFREAAQLAFYDEAIRTRFVANDLAIRQFLEGTLRRLSASWQTHTVSAMAYVIYHASEGIIHNLTYLADDDAVKKDMVIAELSKLLTCYLQQYSSARTVDQEDLHSGNLDPGVTGTGERAR